MLLETAKNGRTETPEGDDCAPSGLIASNRRLSIFSAELARFSSRSSSSQGADLFQYELYIDDERKLMVSYSNCPLSRLGPF